MLCEYQLSINLVLTPVIINAGVITRKPRRMASIKLLLLEIKNNPI